MSCGHRYQIAAVLTTIAFAGAATLGSCIVTKILLGTHSFYTLCLSLSLSHTHTLCLCVCVFLCVSLVSSGRSRSYVFSSSADLCHGFLSQASVCGKPRRPKTCRHWLTGKAVQSLCVTLPACQAVYLSLAAWLQWGVLPLLRPACVQLYLCVYVRACGGGVCVCVCDGMVL